MDIHKKPDLVGSGTRNIFCLKQCLEYLFKHLDVQFSQTDTSDIKVAVQFIISCQCCRESFYELRQN